MLDITCYIVFPESWIKNICGYEEPFLIFQNILHQEALSDAFPDRGGQYTKAHIDWIKSRT